jgi:hypothetical protein
MGFPTFFPMMAAAFVAPQSSAQQPAQPDQDREDDPGGRRRLRRPGPSPER